MPHPKLRSDLILSSERQDHDSPVILKDPVTRRYYRFSAVQARVLAHLDGRKDPGQVAGAAASESGVDVTREQVVTFVEGLRRNALLDDPWCWEKARAARPAHRLSWRSLFRIKLRAYNPDAALDRLERRLRFCFSAEFGLFWLVSVAAALYVTALHWNELVRTLANLWSLRSFPLLAAVVFLVMTVHELGHGIALKHFGGRAEEIGLLILYFMPGLYCSLDDAWLLPRRSRLWITLAGGYVQMLAWAWATLCWRLLAPETLAAEACALIVGFAAVQTLLNFNPLIRLDGYYLLADLLRIPNLRGKSFQFIKQGLARALGLAAPDRRRPPTSARETSAFLLYGVSALAFTGILLWILLDRLGSWMLREYEGWGLVAMALIGFTVVPGREAEARHETGKALSGSWWRKVPRWAVLLVCLLGLSFLPWELRISGNFTILPALRVAVSPEVDGTLASIRVDEGSRVRAGDVLAAMENLDLERALRETRAELETRRARLDLLRSGTRPEEVDQGRRLVATRRAEMDRLLQLDEERRLLQETVAKKETELRQAALDLQRSSSLYAGRLIARADLEKAETARDVIERELSEARAQLKVLEDRARRDWEVKRKEMEEAESVLALLRAGTRPEALKEALMGVRELEEKLAVLRRQEERLQIRSPIDGMVATSYLGNRLGDKLARGSSFCEVVSLGTVIVELPIPEKEIADVSLGMPIDLRVRGFPSREFRARVVSIAPVALGEEELRMVSVRGELNNDESLFRPGMSGVGKVQCGKRLIASLILRRLVRWVRTDFWEYLP